MVVPGHRRALSLVSTEKGMGDQRAQASGSVRVSMTCSGVARTVVRARQVLAVVNFPPRKIGPFMSEVLTLGLPDEEGAVVLIKPDLKVPNGGKLF